MRSLQRFVDAQCRVYDTALAELTAGRKRSHWMWFDFPQLAGLGHSEMARRFALEDIAEARAYFDHPVLGPRLRACTEAVLAQSGANAVDVLGAVDAVKLRSSMTLFALAAPGEAVFPQVLAAWFADEPDPLTVSLAGPRGA